MDEIFIALFIFAQQHKVIRVVVHPMYLVMARAARDIDLTADDRLDARRLRRTIKVNDAIHDAVVCNGNGILPDCLHMLHHGGNAIGAIEQAEFGMYVQMHKAHVCSSSAAARAIDTMRRMRWLSPGLEIGGSRRDASSDRLAVGSSSRRRMVSCSASGKISHPL